jgi:hypothetical protein
MEAGFVPDRGHSNRITPDTWVAGEPEKSFWVGTKVKGKAQLEIHALRCPRCGRLELYAPDR